jgi:predicted nucleotidyltransferase
MAPSIAAAVADFAARVRGVFGARVREMCVFGSHARAEANEDSDVDVAVVVDGMSGAEGRAIAYLAGDLLTERDILISAFAISSERMDLLRARERLIAAEIARDGIPV